MGQSEKKIKSPQSVPNMSGHILLHDMTMYAKFLRPDSKGQCVVTVSKFLTVATLLCRHYELLNMDMDKL